MSDRCYKVRDTKIAYTQVSEGRNGRVDWLQNFSPNEYSLNQ